MRIAPLLLGLLVAGCSIKADFTGTLFHCGDNDSCPASYVCLQTYCVPDVPDDAGVDAAAASCGGGDIALGLEHSCTLRSDGSTWCWGRNDYGQVGDGSFVDQTKPVQVAGLPTAKQLTAGSLHTCALAAGDGSIWCWGHNDAGELGDGTVMDSRVPLQVPSITGALAVAAGDQHTCAVLADHSVACWGYNGFGQLGDNTVMNHKLPAPVMMLAGATAIAAGGNTTCAVKDGGTAWCWGENDEGAVGNGDESGNNVLLPAQVTGLTGATSVAVGLYSSCALDNTGRAWCWGDSDWGQLGDGEMYTVTFTPVAVEIPAKVVQLATGQLHACALDDQHRMWCWGDDEYNQFGDGTRNQRPTPELAFTNVDTMATGGVHTCLQIAGALECAGDNVRGELGFGQESAVLVPTTSPALAGLTKIAAGSGFACGIAPDTSVSCWGVNTSGQLGDATFKSHTLPAPVFGLTNVIALTAGQAHACALQTGGTVVCWGAGSQGQLGDGTTPNSRPVAEPVALGGPATQISAGYFHTCAVVGGLAKCWGRAVNNSLDNGSVSQTAVSTPFTVPMLTGVTQIAAGDQHTCALKMDGSVVCWGLNGNGQLGNNSVMPAPGFVSVVGIANVSEIASDGDYTCARESGSIVCWGEGYDGRCGNGLQNASQPVPVGVLNISTAAKLFVGPDHACVTLQNNNFECWGTGGSGQIGDNTVVDKLAPQQINTSNVTSAASGPGFTCVSKSDGTVQCWGDDHQGQLGDGLDTTTTNTVHAVALTCP